MQNVHTRGNPSRKVPLFGQFAGRLPHLDSRRGICYNFVKIRHGAGCAGRSPFSPCGGYFCPEYFFKRRHEGVCFRSEGREQAPFLCKGGLFHEHQDCFARPPHRAGGIALAFLLPMVTGHVPQVGNMLCPMHFPILLCGFVLGGPWGLAVGFVAPLLRSVLFGMPPMFPIAVSMAFELAAYGLVSGLVWRRVKHTLPMMYAALVTAMVAGRLVWGAVRFVLAGLTGSSFPFSAFLSGALLTAVPGIIAQLILIPLILTALQKAKVIA